MDFVRGYELFLEIAFLRRLLGPAGGDPPLVVYLSGKVVPCKETDYKFSGLFPSNTSGCRNFSGGRLKPEI